MNGKACHTNLFHSPVVIGPLQRLRPRVIERRKTPVRAISTDTSGGDGSHGGGGGSLKQTGWDGERYDRSGNPLGLLTLAVSILAWPWPLTCAHSVMQYVISRSQDPPADIGTCMQIAGSLTAYQVKDILEEPFWLEDTQLKSVSIIVPVRTS